MIHREVKAFFCKDGNRPQEFYESTLTLLGSLAAVESMAPVADSWWAARWSGLFLLLLLIATAARFVLLLLLWLSSLRKLGPLPTTGVAKFSGLGSVLLLSPPRKFHSG